MNSDFIKSENFKARFITGVILATIVALSFFTKNASMFRVLYFASAMMAGLELFLAHHTSLFRTPAASDNRIIIFEYILIILSIYSICMYFDRKEMIIVIIGAISTDTFAYFVGSALHDKLFKKRPFPKISPKKSWEGIIGGYLGSVITLIVIFSIMGEKIDLRYIVFIILCPIISIFGDWLASFCKRFLEIKDSNECVLSSNLVLPKIFEKLMKGHGGFLDRIDSISAVACLMFWTKISSF